MGFRYTRVLQFNFEDAQGYGVDRVRGRDIVELAERLGANTVVFFARDAWGRAYYDSRIMRKVEKLGGRDLLREIVEEAGRRGIAVVPMIGHTTNPELYSLHPEWAQRDRQGRVITMDTDPAGAPRQRMTWPLMCLNTPFLERVVEEAEEVLGFGVDGVFLDSFRYMPDADRACFCEHCEERYRREKGRSLPRVEVDEDYYREAFEWRVGVNVEALRRVSEAVHRAGGILVYNSHPLSWRGRANTIAERASGLVDVFFAECSEADYQPPGFIAEMTKLTRALTGKPVWASRNSFHMSLTPQETTPLVIRMGVREAFAGGGWPLLLVFSSTFLEGLDPEPLAEAFREVERLEEYMEGAEPLPYVAVAWSNRTRDWAGRGQAPHVADAYRGFYYLLMTNGYPVNYVSDTCLDSGCYSRYRAVVLPGVESMSREAAGKLRGYLESGGGLVATFNTGMRDERGHPLEETLLREALGIGVGGVLELPWSYVELGDSHPVTAGLARRRILWGDYDREFIDRRTPPRGAWHAEVTSMPRGTRVLGRVVAVDREYGNEYENGRSPPPPGPRLDYPSILVGERWVYLSGQGGRLWWRHGSPQIGRLLLNSILYAAGEPPVRVESGGLVELEAYRRRGEILVHLLNHTYADRIITGRATARNTMWTSTPEAVHPPTRVAPLGDVRLVLRGIEAVRVYEPLTGERLEVRRGEGAQVVELPRLDEYSFIVIEVAE